MNKISNISFGQIILSKRVKKAMAESQENSEILNDYNAEKPDCYIDLYTPRKNNLHYLRAVNSYNITSDNIFVEIPLGKRKIPYISDILNIYSKFKKAVDKHFAENIEDTPLEDLSSSSKKEA